eukprot:scaffold211544_cov48-Attheya_sp.AAC.1
MRAGLTNQLLHVYKKKDEIQKKEDAAAAKASEIIRLRAARAASKELEAKHKARVSWRKTREAALAIRQTGKTQATFTIPELKKMIRYKRGPGNKEKNSNKQDELLTMYQPCAHIPSPPVSDDEDEGIEEVRMI